jgi:hypothetical protein
VKFARNILILVLAVFGAAGPAHGAITFTITPQNATIEQGTNAVFNIFMSSPTNEIVGGYSINVLAGAGNGTGGVFLGGTFDFLVGAPVQTWDVGSTPGQAFSTADTGTSGGTGLGNLLVANTPTRLGTLTLRTNNVAAATYQMSMSSLSAIQVNGLPIVGSSSGAVNGGAISYTISAVPEPSSLLLLATAGCALFRFRRVGYRVFQNSLG